LSRLCCPATGHTATSKCRELRPDEKRSIDEMKALGIEPRLSDWTRSRRSRIGKVIDFFPVHVGYSASRSRSPLELPVDYACTARPFPCKSARLVTMWGSQPVPANRT
jgi:hypothetical protein